jgi:coproporphyrinogen III oxidase-like Fe-S oxidoreductase
MSVDNNEEPSFMTTSMSPTTANNLVGRVFMPSELRFAAMPPLALYIHLPWCVRKCPYCDFNSHLAPESKLREVGVPLISDINPVDTNGFATPISERTDRRP